jgi:hypothetical protein
VPAELRRAAPHDVSHDPLLLRTERQRDCRIAGVGAQDVGDLEVWSIDSGATMALSMSSMRSETASPTRRPAPYMRARSARYFGDRVASNNALTSLPLRIVGRGLLARTGRKRSTTRLRRSVSPKKQRNAAIAWLAVDALWHWRMRRT